MIAGRPRRRSGRSPSLSRARARARRLRRAAAPGCGREGSRRFRSALIARTARCRGRRRRPDKRASCRRSGRDSTHWPARSAGRIVLSTWSARAAANSKASACGAPALLVAGQQQLADRSRRPRFRQARGSRRTSMPRSASAAASAATWVDLPTPSPPSRLMKRPRALTPFRTSCLKPSQMRPKKPASLDVLAGDQRHDLRRRCRRS